MEWGGMPGMRALKSRAGSLRAVLCLRQTRAVRLKLHSPLSQGKTCTKHSPRSRTHMECFQPQVVNVSQLVTYVHCICSTPYLIVGQVKGRHTLPPTLACLSCGQATNPSGKPRSHWATTIAVSGGPQALKRKFLEELH